MLPAELLDKIKSENELLQLQLQDVNYMISIREEELDILRAKANNAVQLKSELEGTYNALGQMQEIIGQKQHEAQGAARREAAMEEEIIQSITIEKEYLDIKARFASTHTALDDIKDQLSEANTVFKDLSIAHSKIAELESRLEIAEEEKELLQYELSKQKKITEKLQQGFG